MTDLLTSEEIDTLLELFRAEGGALDEAEEQILRVAVEDPAMRRADVIDLLAPRELQPRQKDSLERWLGAVDHSLAIGFRDRLRLESSCECTGIERRRWRDVCEDEGEPVEVLAMSLAPLSDRSALTVSSNLLRIAVDRLLGGSGIDHGDQSRIRAAEVAVAAELIDGLCAGVAHGLAPLEHVKPRFLEHHAALRSLRSIGEHETVLAVHYRTEVGSESGEIRLIVPYCDISQPLERSLERDEPRLPPGAMRDAVGRSLGHLPVALGIELGSAELTLSELMGLRKGDIVRLDTRIGGEVRGMVQGRQRLRGTVAPVDGRMTFRVTEQGGGERHE